MKSGAQEVGVTQRGEENKGDKCIRNGNDGGRERDKDKEEK